METKPDVATLEVENLTAQYPDLRRPALKVRSLILRPGERTAVLGWNGAGKTTLLLAVAGLLPFSGTVRLDGQPLTKKTAAALRRKIGLLFAVPDDQLLFPSVREDVAFSVRQTGVPSETVESITMELLRSFELEACADRPPFQLSHGQRQRTALAGLLARRPSLLLLDEPTGHLDPPGRKELRTLLRRQSSAQLIATHDVGFAAALCQRYLWLEEGRVTREGTDFSELTLLMD
ncbi:MAG TPA: ABC transporter ATP-binding protein [Acidobacteriota bacterium]|jgi:cobalt/nickel transport system ATP-binding protein|nr:ABC transporter ATP-binding protein [Acidobacteriota bacterium]HRR25328.1 ABC transporter ATP-binding protein [Acidobacteriota bacterium]HRR55495.1 ABC transporter ATP-binding protein [Acidobacteriota bacterium]HRV07250.1 ABC transporter ATP-binding protein [Acidobacteriota bacterium]